MELSPEYYAEILAIMAHDDEMQWDEIEQTMKFLKTHVEWRKSQ